MTRKEAIRQLDGADMMLLNREFKPFNQAVIMAISALRERGNLATNLQPEASFSCKWISVNERLPELGKRVLVYSVFDGMNIGFVQSDGRFTVKTPYPDRPTHWMPLPEPPKEDTPC